MKLITKVGDGAFGDVWEGLDDLDRKVAVKIIRMANEAVAGALTHAKALARVIHENVVTVHGVQRVDDPVSGESVDCVVMEFLEGETLQKRLGKDKFSQSRVLTVGSQLLHAVGAIHKSGIAHGDLHAENIIFLNDERVKVIDILYLDSLAMLTTERKDKKLARDLTALRFLLHDIIAQSELGPSRAKDFNNTLDAVPDLDAIHSAFLGACSPTTDASKDAVPQILYYLADDGFVNTQDYADAVLERLPLGQEPELLKQILNKRVYKPDHEKLINTIWSRLSEPEKQDCAKYIGPVLDKEVPNGTWGPVLQLVTALGTRLWRLLPKLTRLRLEKHIVTDTLAGRRDIHSGKLLTGGALGTYAMKTWPAFEDKGQLAKNLISLLRQSWYTQNYVGQFFMHMLAPLAQETGTEEEFIDALRTAVDNDAKTLKGNLSELSDAWQIKLNA